MARDGDNLIFTVAVTEGAARSPPLVIPLPRYEEELEDVVDASDESLASEEEQQLVSEVVVARLWLRALPWTAASLTDFRGTHKRRKMKNKNRDDNDPETLRTVSSLALLLFYFAAT